MIAVPVLPYNRYITENPGQTAAMELRWAKIYRVASIVAGVAFCAIFGVGLFLSAGLIPIHPAFIIPIAIGASLAQSIMDDCKLRARGCSERALIPVAKARELYEMRNWSADDVRTFFTEHHLALDKLPEDPLVLLPAIAAFCYTWREAQAALQEYERVYNGVYPNRARFYAARYNANQFMENEVLPRVLEAALILQIIQDPTSELELKDFSASPIENDDCFLFNDSKLPNLHLPVEKNLLTALRIDSLRGLLFDTFERRRALNLAINGLRIE